MHTDVEIPLPALIPDGKLARLHTLFTRESAN